MGLAVTSRSTPKNATATHRIARIAGNPLAEICIESSGVLSDGSFGSVRFFDIMTALLSS
jgi:hypothetical protein